MATRRHRGGGAGNAEARHRRCDCDPAYREESGLAAPVDLALGQLPIPARYRAPRWFGAAPSAEWAHHRPALIYYAAACGNFRDLSGRLSARMKPLLLLVSPTPSSRAEYYRRV